MEKSERDKKIDEEAKAARLRGDAVPHKDVKSGKKDTVKTVTDPTTGHQVEVRIHYVGTLWDGLRAMVLNLDANDLGNFRFPMSDPTKNSWTQSETLLYATY